MYFYIPHIQPWAVSLGWDGSRVFYWSQSSQPNIPPSLGVPWAYPQHVVSTPKYWNLSGPLTDIHTAHSHLHNSLQSGTKIPAHIEIRIHQDN